jgi:hypothetical protein
MSPDKFLARLCALVPPPGAHAILYYGVLAGRHTLRSRVVDVLGLAQLLAQACVVMPQLLELGLLRGTLGLGSAFARQRLQRTFEPLPPPVRQVRRVQALSSQQGADLARLGERSASCRTRSLYSLVKRRRWALSRTSVSIFRGVAVAVMSAMLLGAPQ